MKLLDQIIELLSNDSGSLNEALLKTKVLLHKIGQKELTPWVTQELNGYDNDTAVPSYRQAHATVLGNVTNGYMRYTNHPLPIRHLTKMQQDGLQNVPLRQSLAVLQQYTSKPEGVLKSNIPLEYNGLLGKTISDGFHIEQAWTQIPCSQFIQAITEVRSRLLDFVLNLQSKLGEDISEGQVKEAAANIDAKGLFNNSVFGDGATIVLGNQNAVTNAATVHKGDFASLERLLKKHGVADHDVVELKSAIVKDADSPELAQGKVGPQVNGWLKGMLAKAVDAAWQIELGVAGGLLTNAIQAYYFSQ
ncbi:hypothetical protein [Variovorax sp. E3]|uniref:AbiTii domain-containing protein n=1 Tax=Variovorax sp. E3 TaxID=1914993 RepID=UPI0018DB6644|nr:hypothetical protein [Variovorax sp. E3]